MLKKIVLAAISLVMILSLISCSRKKDEMSSFLIVTAFKPYSLVVNQIAEKTCTTRELFSDAGDLQKDKLSNKQMRLLNKARLIILNGNLEEKYKDQLVPFKDKIIYVSGTVNQVRVALNKDYPYYWLDGDLMMELARSVNMKLSEINVNYTATYEDRLKKMLDDYDNYLIELTKNKYSNTVKFDKELFFLQNYQDFHQLSNSASQINKNKSIGTDNKNDIKIDLWMNKDYKNIIDYYTKNFGLLINQEK
jgi:ABC-type Zn uptake system ZnuABC Zn-binding protein ZnuA